VPFAGVWAGVEQFLRIDPCRRRARDIADVVGAGTARAQAKVLNAFDQRDRMFRRNFTDLQISAGGDMTKRPAIALGEIGHACELPVREDAVRDSQAAHVGILRRCDIKQTVITPAKIIRRRRRRVGQRLRLQPRIGIERMFLALEFFLVRELLAGRDDLVLRPDVRRLGSHRFCAGLAGSGATEAAPDPADLQARGKTFEVAFLLVGKVD
jgi:hypothetical protein